MTSESQEAIESIYHRYLTEIQPLIVTYEALDGRFPVAVLNEIRAVFTHLARCYEHGRNESEQLKNAERHLERVHRDCFKYLCIAYTDEYKEFMRTYRCVDLSLIDNGDFLPRFSKKYSEAKNLLIEAKKLESLNEDDILILEAYEKAANEYTEFYEMISGENLAKFIKLKRKTRFKRFIEAVGLVIGIPASIKGLFSGWH